MTRQITVYEEYDDPTLVKKIWEKMRDDYYSVFKAQYPNAGRGRYREIMVITITEFTGLFFYYSGEDYDPLTDEVRGKTLENFIGKPDDDTYQFHPSDRTLRYCHTYLLVRYPQISSSLRKNEYAEQYAEMLMAKYHCWKKTNSQDLQTLKSLSPQICGIYVNDILENWPDNQGLKTAPEYEAAKENFGGEYRLMILSSLKVEPILLVHYLSFSESDIPKLKQGNIDQMEIGRASGAAVPFIVGAGNRSYLIRFQLFMSNRIQSDLPYDFPIIVRDMDYTEENSNIAIHSFTAERFDYAPQSKFIRSKKFETAGKKLFDLYGVDI